MYVRVLLPPAEPVLFKSSVLWPLRGCYQPTRWSDLPLSISARAAVTYVIAMKVDPYTWTEGGSFWEVGVPEVSSLETVTAARAEIDKGKSDQRVGW